MEATWEAHGQQAKALRRPDRRWQIWLPDRTQAWPALLAERPEDVTPVVIDLTEELSLGQREVLEDAGMRVARTEQVRGVPLSGLARRTDVTVHNGAHRLVPVTSCDLDRVAGLDTVVRQQIPGTEEWVTTRVDLAESLQDDEFDPDLYLAAEHRATGSYDGLVRVWWRPGAPRIGCLGVTPPWRRTRLAGRLLSQVVGTLLERGVHEVVAETDVRNSDSHRLAAAHGGVPVSRRVEWSSSAGTHRLA